MIEETTELKNIIPIQKASKILGVTAMTLRRWEKIGRLPSFRIGEGKSARRFYRQEDIEALTQKV